MYNYRKLLVLGVNELISQGKISLETPASDTRTDEKGYLMTKIGGYPSVIIWESISFSELRISVWWNYDHSKHPQANAVENALEQFRGYTPLAKKAKFPHFVGACVSGWLERDTAKNLQGTGNRGITKTYLRHDMKTPLANLPVPVAKGYKAEGQLFL